MPIEAVALKLFTGIENFEIMAIPFFILAGNFLTHGGVARRMIAFATSMVGHWYGGLGPRRRHGLRAVRGRSRAHRRATVVAIGSIMLPAMVQQGYPKRFGAGVIATVGRARHPDSAVDRHGDLLRWRPAAASRIDPDGKRVLVGLGRPVVHGRRGARPDPRHACSGITTFYRAWKNDYPRMPKATLGGALCRVPQIDLGPAADRDRARRHLRGAVHADRSRRHERGLRLRHRGVRLPAT